MIAQYLLRLAVALACLAIFTPELPAAPSPDPSGQIRVATAHWAITLFVADDGRLCQLGCGPADRNLPLPRRAPARETEFYPPYGDGFILEPAVQATHADGNTSTDLLHVKHDTQVVDTNITLTRIELKDPAYAFFVTLCLRTYRQEDMIEQWTEVRQQEEGPVTLYRFASSTPVLKAKDYWLTQFHGDYQREATLAEEKLSPGMKVLDSKIGVRASRFRLPSLVLSLDGPAQEDAGEVLGGSLAWSGSFQLAFDLDWENRLRALCGINPAASQYRLPPGQTFTTPAMLWSWSDHGKGQVSRNFHRWALRYGIRDGDKPRPVLLNNWEATYFNFDESAIVALFDGAKELGVDTFLLDDGWFGNRHARNHDRAGLGDWQVNTNKLPHGLAYLASEANKRGVNFGIWIEPEMVNPASDLFELHPDWAIRQPHRELELSRNQLDLDLSRPEVREFAWGVVDQTLGTPGVSYVKWDANRYVTQPGSPYLPANRQSELLIDYNFALYDIMARMAARHPSVFSMACSGGGGRVDYGTLKYFHSFWPSDNTDPRSRVFIQWGFSHFFPAATMAAHVTRMGNRPMKFCVDVAMSAALGLDLDVRKLTPADRATLAASIALYKRSVRDLVEQGDLYRLESPYDHPRAALDYVNPSQDRALLFVYQIKDSDDARVKIAGLNPDLHYRVHELNLAAGASSRLSAEGELIAGALLMSEGLIPPCHQPFESAVIELTAQK